MSVHRFYISDKIELKSDVWINDKDLIHQWTKVLRITPENQISLFDNQEREVLYRIDRVEKDAVHLKQITEMEPKSAEKKIYLCFSLLKKDKNEWILQKATEIGVSHFVPLISERVIKSGFNIERAEKIVIEASEQCGRVDVPKVREPVKIETAIDELKDKCEIYVAEQNHHSESSIFNPQSKPLAVFIGPEGGWSDSEKEFFKANEIHHISLGQFTLRAETAAIIAPALLQ